MNKRKVNEKSEDVRVRMKMHVKIDAKKKMPRGCKMRRSEWKVE